MPLQSTVPFMVITTIITLVGGVLPLAHYVIAGEPRRTMIDNWDRMLFRRDKKIDRIVKESK